MYDCEQKFLGSEYETRFMSHRMHGESVESSKNVRNVCDALHIKNLLYLFLRDFIAQKNHIYNKIKIKRIIKSLM